MLWQKDNDKRCLHRECSHFMWKPGGVFLFSHGGESSTAGVEVIYVHSITRANFKMKAETFHLGEIKFRCSANNSLQFKLHGIFAGIGTKETLILIYDHFDF